MSTAKQRTSPNPSVLTGRKIGRKFDKEEEEGRKKMEHIVRKKEVSSKKKRTTYLLGPESETPPVSPRSSSTKPAGSSSWSASSPGSAEAMHTPVGSSGRGEGDQGSQDFCKGVDILQTLCAQNCQTAAYNCTAEIAEGNLNSEGGKTTAPLDTDLQTNGKDRIICNLDTAASLATEHQCQDGCNSQGGLQAK